jgi:hypothetical protein
MVSPCMTRKAAESCRRRPAAPHQISTTTPEWPARKNINRYSRGSVMWPVRALAATVAGEARKTCDSLWPMRPGKFRLVALMHFMGVHAAEGVHRPAQAGRAPGVFGHLHAGVNEDLPDRLAVPARRLQIMHDLRRGRHAEGVDDHFLAAQHAGETPGNRSSCRRCRSRRRRGPA